MPKTFTVKQVAEALNFSTNTVYKYLEEGRIKAVRLGSSGHFKIPASELSRLLGEVAPVPPSPATPEPPPELPAIPLLPSPHHLHLFDWFLAITAILLGTTYLIYPLQNLTLQIDPPIFLYIAKIGLILTGSLLIGVDLITPHKHPFIYTLRTLPLAAIYLLLSFIFFTSQSYLNLVISLILTLFSLFSGAVTGSFLRFIFFCSALASLPAISILFISKSPFLSPDFWHLYTSYPVASFVVILILTLAFLFTSLGMLRRKSGLLFLPLFIAGILFLFTSALFLSRILWTPAIIFLTAGSFAFLFPFSARINSQLPLTHKQYLITFAWFITIIIIGTFIISLNQNAFEKLELDSQAEKINTAVQMTTAFLENSTKFVTTYSQNSDLVSLLSQNHPDTTALQNLSRSFYLNSTTFRRLLFANAQGQIIAEYPLFTLPPQSLDISQRAYFHQAQSSTTPVVSESIFPISRDIPAAVVVAAPVLSHGKFIGLVIGSLDLDKLSFRLNNVSAVNPGSFTLVDQNKHIFLSARHELLGQPLPPNHYLSPALSGSIGQLITPSLTDNSLSFVAYSPISSAKWAIAIETPYAPTASRNAYLSFTILLLTLSLGSGTLIVSWYLRNTS